MLSSTKTTRIALTALHTALAVGLTTYSAIGISASSNPEHTNNVYIIAWVNFAVSLLIWAFLSHIIKRELYWLIAGFDDSQPFDKNVLNTMLNKMINAVIISFFAVTLSQVPFLFVSGEFPVGLHIGLLCGMYFLMLLWIVVIVLKYQKRALIKN